MSGRRFLLSIVVLGVACGLTLPTGAQAQPVLEDSVVGVATVGEQTFAFDAHSGPSGEDPRGMVTYQPFTRPFTLPVTCVTVSGSRATVGVFEFGRPGIEFGAFFFVEDNDGQGQDHLRFDSLVSPPPTSCPLEPLPGGPSLQPIITGDITVTDSEPFPTSKDHCKNGGWRNRGTTFENQGDCISFVATSGKNPPAD
jgi:hypothetical protein